MLLAFDIGNTNIVLGVFQNNKLTHNWRMKTDRNKSADEYGMIVNQLFQYAGIKTEDVEDIIISTVVPPVVHTLQHMALKYFKKTVMLVGPGIKTGMVIKTDNPKQVGTDRIVNAVAAYHKYGGPVIVVDFGTATTVCAISQEGVYLGGTITAGIKISGDALFEKTSKLPKVELTPPGKVIGKNTVTSMQAGLVYGHMGVVDYIIKKMKIELCGDDDVKVNVIATGGFASVIANEVEVIDHVDKMLTLEGLKLIYERNR